jgi:hypothetical protein
VCKDCVVSSDEHDFCSEECLHQFTRFKERYKVEEKKSKRTIVGQLALLIGAIVVVVIAIKLGAARKVPFFQRLNEKIFGGSPAPQGKLEESAPRR